MQCHFSRLAGRPCAVAAVALLALSLWPCVARAQSAQTRRDEWRAEMESRQRALRKHSDAARRPPPKARDSRPSYQDVAKDFEQLQVRSYQLSLAAGAGARHDYKQIREHAAEIRRRASRLKQTLALPDVPDAPKQKRSEVAFTPGSLAAAVVSLEAAVQSFAWNPTFQRPDVVVVENSIKARHDLEEILALCERIGKAADALGKGKTDGKDN